ncbi:hypothetical protein GCM10022221_63480 [Actinocorallia aurea]
MPVNAIEDSAEQMTRSAVERVKASHPEVEVRRAQVLAHTRTPTVPVPDTPPPPAAVRGEVLVGADG